MIFKNSAFDFCFIFSVSSSELTHRQRQKDRQKVENNLLGLIHISRKNPHTLMRLSDIVDDENIDFLTLSVSITSLFLYLKVHHPGYFYFCLLIFLYIVCFSVSLITLFLNLYLYFLFLFCFIVLFPRFVSPLFYLILSKSVYVSDIFLLKQYFSILNQTFLSICFFSVNPFLYLIL